MIDDNWEEVAGDDAHEIEVLNYANQVNVIEALVRYFLHRHPAISITGCPLSPNENVLKEFHRTATLFLLSAPGKFRTEQVYVYKDSVIVHTPPAHEAVPGKMGEFFNQLQARWSTDDAITLAAFTLWFVNWVHPFKNGNGRTARAFSYACLELKLGFILPGTKTVIDLVMENRGDYNSALKMADQTYEAGMSPDLMPMSALIARLLEEQLSSVGD